MRLVVIPRCRAHDVTVQSVATCPSQVKVFHSYIGIHTPIHAEFCLLEDKREVGFLDEFSYQTKQSLVYDLEPFRWFIDFSVAKAFESKTLDLDDLYFTGDDYRYRFEHDARLRLIKVLREQFNSGVKFKERVLKWDTVVAEKTNELARYLADRTTSFELMEPTPVLERADNRAIREAILCLTQEKSRSIGIWKNTLHYLRKNARTSQSFKIHSTVQTRLGSSSIY